MKLVRYGEPGCEKPAVLNEDGTLTDVSPFIKEYDEAFWRHGGIAQLRELLATRRHECPVISSPGRLGPPLARPSKIVCIGLNFSDHAEESGMELPAEPVVFFKATSAYVGPNDDLRLPRGGDKTDWEVELAVVINQTARYVAEKDAEQYVAGYALHNDYSERSFQLERCGQWVKGKSCDTFAPVGPWLVTPDEIPDVNQLHMWLKVNGETMQSGNTNKLVFKIPFLVHYLSQFMTLLPGDIISTGTPPGVGLGFDPPRFLKAGDVVELGIDGLGTARQKVQPPL